LEFRGAELARLRGAPPGHVYRCDLQLDSNGFRNPPGLERAEVIVLGDSFIEGLQVAADELMTARLSGLLGRTVANLGRTSYGPQQELEVLRRYGLGFSPSMCIWAFYEGNDLQDLGAYEAEAASVARALNRKDSDSRYERSFARNSLAYLIRNWIHPDPGLPAALYTGHLVDPAGRPRDLFFATGIQHGEGGPRLPRGQATPEVQGLLEILGGARELCHRHSIELVLVFVPSKFRVYRTACRFPPASPCPAWPIDELGRELQAAIRRRWPDLAFFELTPGFVAAATSGSIVYLPDDTHWSSEGHRLAAELIGKSLVAGHAGLAMSPK
jgi:hypothetical protein